MGKKTGENTYEYIVKNPKNFKPLYNVYDKIMEALPVEEAAKLEHTFSMEFEPASVMTKAYWKNFIKKVTVLNRDPTYGPMSRLAKQGATIMDTMVDLGGIGNMTQELFWRRAFFVRAVEKYARERGYLGAEDYWQALKAGRTDSRTTMIGGFRNAEEALARLKKLKEEDIPQMADETVTKMAQSFKKRMKDPYKLGNRILKARKNIIDDLNKKADEAIRLLEAKVNPNEALGVLPDSLAKRLGGEVETDMTVISRARHEAHVNTFAATPPQHTFAGHVLQAYRTLPLAGVGPWFPRFLSNLYTWMNERNPLAYSQFAKTRIAQELDAFVGKGTTVGLSRRALDEWARHVDGIIMLGTAKFIQGSSLAGPAYYQVWTGLKDKEGNKIFWDVRPLQPFSTFMFLQKAFSLAATGASFKGKISPSDISDALVGVRRLQDQLGFAFTDLVRQISTDNPDSFWRSVKRLAGQPLAMPFLGLRGFVNMLADVGLGKTYSEVRDMTGQELTGPVLNDIAPSLLPKQYDPYTGEVRESKVDIATKVPPFIDMTGKEPTVKEHVELTLGPRFRQLTGMSLQEMSPLEEYFSHLGISTTDLVGRWKSQEASALVRRVMGEILGRKQENGETTNAALARILREGLRTVPDPLARMLIMKEFVIPFRKAVVDRAALEAPKVFAKEERGSPVKVSAPKVMQPMFQKFIEEGLPSHIDWEKIGETLK